MHLIRNGKFVLIVASRKEVEAYASQAEAQNRKGGRSEATKATKRSQKCMTIMFDSGTGSSSELCANGLYQNPEWRSRLKKDPGIPNLYPYKDRLLHEIEEKKRLKEEEFVRKRDEAKARKGMVEAAENKSVPDAAEAGSEEELVGDEEMDEDIDADSANPMAALLASAKARADEYEEGSEDDDDMDEDDDEGDLEIDSTPNTSIPRSLESSRRAFDKVFKTVLSSADILLYVIDARDPNGTRSRDIERQITALDGGSKRLILILNKIDLVPPPVLKNWLVYLRRYFPTLPLRASNPAPNARTFDHKALTVKGTSETLLRALKTYASGRQLKRSISVGVVGYPNVGKSSVINALTSRLGGSGNAGSRNNSTACPVGAEAGVTTALREVKIDNKLKLLDSPGIVFPSAAEGEKTSKKDEQARLILLNAIPPKQISDPIPAVSLLLKRLSSSQDSMKKLMDVYGLPPLMTAGEDATTDFLVQVARKRGRLGKGGVPNINSAAMTVLMDWRDGRIQGWADAPVVGVADASKPADAADEMGDRKEIVKEWAKEFKLEGLWGDGAADAEEVMQE